MDLSAIINLLVASVILQTGVEAVVKGAGGEAGKSLYHTIVSQGRSLLSKIRSKFSQDQNISYLDILSEFEVNPESMQKELEMALQEAIKDAGLARELLEIYKQIKVNILDILKGFTSEQLDELNLRLGFRPGEVYSSNAIKFQKISSILDIVEARTQYPALVKEMLSVNPYLIDR